jgi:hypothetical protein
VVYPVNNSGLLPYNVVYQITCAGSGGSVTASTTVSVIPTVTVTVTSPTAGQTFADGSTMNVQWTPASAGVAVIQLVSTNGGESPIMYANKVDGYPVNYSGSYSFSVPWGISGSYYVRLMNPENDQTVPPNPPGTVVGNSGVFTITATNTSAPTATDQTAVIVQSFQGILNQLAGILKSL